MPGTDIEPHMIWFIHMKWSEEAKPESKEDQWLPEVGSREQEWEMTVNAHRASFWCIKNAIQSDCGMVAQLRKYTKTHWTANRCILWYAKYILIKLYKKAIQNWKFTSSFILATFLSAQESHLASGYHNRQCRDTKHFQHYGKFYWTELFQNIKKQDKNIK